LVDLQVQPQPIPIGLVPAVPAGAVVPVPHVRRERVPLHMAEAAQRCQLVNPDPELLPEALVLAQVGVLLWAGVVGPKPVMAVGPPLVLVFRDAAVGAAEPVP